ncbi:MAG: prepilin peptidase [Acidobacteria bacterium]|nr:prepilin peptidase [Acidobacteriota bacterium]
MVQLGIVFLSGLIAGSFLNVVIARVPEGRSVVTPRSRCPRCSTAIAFYDNIPLLSYLLLSGKCRHCGGLIPRFYPLVELLTGLIFAAAYWRFGTGPALWLNALFFSTLLALIFIDLRHRVLPDRITYPLLLTGLCFSYFQDPSLMGSQLLERWLDPSQPGEKLLLHGAQSLLGALAGGGALWLVRFLYLRFKGVEGMGRGDVKLMAAAGAFLGWNLAWLTIFLGSLLGAVIGSLYIFYHRKDFRYELPFGTFLGIAAIASSLWGREMLQWYAAFYR